jgi:hypothetical protein
MEYELWSRPPGITEAGLPPWLYAIAFDGREYIVGPDGKAWHYPELSEYLCAIYQGFPPTAKWEGTRTYDYRDIK